MRVGRKSGWARRFASLTFFLSFACVGEIRVFDDLGREIVLHEPAKRIISLAPHNTENLFTAGAGRQIVGTVDHSDFPEQALAIPRIGDYRQINIEALIKLKPDLIVAWSSGNKRETVERLISLNLPVFYSEPLSFEQVISNIERLALLTGQSRQVAHQIEQINQNYQALKREYRDRPHVNIFYQVWDKPLITLNRAHSVSQAFKVCGGTNVFANAPVIAPRVNIEGVVAKNPQLILLAGDNRLQSMGWARAWANWPSIEAVAHQQLKHVDPNLLNRPTSRFLKGMEQICELIEHTRQALAE